MWGLNTQLNVMIAAVLLPLIIHLRLHTREELKRQGAGNVTYPGRQQSENAEANYENTPKRLAFFFGFALKTTGSIGLYL